MAQIAYWIAHATSGWTGTPTGAQIVAGNQSDNSAATFSGSESAPGSGSGTITEATATTGASASTAYTIAWVVYDDVALTYSNVVTGEITTLGVDGTATGVTLRAAARFLGGGATGVRNATVGGVALRAAARFVAGGAVGTGAAVASGATLRAALRFNGGGASAVRNPTVAGATLRAALRFNGGGAFVPGDGGYRHGRLNVRIGLGL